jgi:nucleotide-binding universal stress UspA family protein
MFSSVLVGADGSATARRAVEAAAEMAAVAGGTLHIVTAFDPKSYAGGTRPNEYEYINADGDVDALLQELSFIAKKHNLTPVMHAGKGDPADVLIKKAEEIGVDLIVVGNQGMKGVRRVLGSVPNSVAHGAPCSVLIVDTNE